MKKIAIVLFVFSLSFFSAQKIEKKRLGFFTNLEANIGLDLKEIIQNNQAKTDYEKAQVPPGKFNYGFTGSVGYQFLDWFALHSGIRYSFIDPNYHLLYWTAQPYFIIGKNESEDFSFLFLNLGTKINQTATKNAGFIGLGIGKIEPLGKRFGHKVQLYVEGQQLDNDGSVFVGLSYGISLFSNQQL